MQSFPGESLIYGQLGQIMVIIALISSLLFSIAYFYQSNEKTLDTSWRRLGRWAFGMHMWSLLSILALLFYLIFNHFYEYYYVWQHSSNSLPLRYIFSCFWEGQEGSFLLWAFWHAVLGCILILRNKEWEAPVMSIIGMVQFFLCTMLLGIYIGDYKIGTDPFILLRQHPDMANLPFIQMPDYLSRITDGRGLNPLLQNYWMTIHPPVLFLGFASTLIPFAFAMGGLWKGKVTEWIKPAISWTFWGIMILGIGILMGAAWAYESLSFGGFWAWDPVENASFVPWLILVGAGHVMLIYQSRKHSVVSAFLLSIGSFIFVLYSTFLTRSGILGNSSVHAFTDLGMSGQLLVYLLFFVFLGVGLLIYRWKSIPRTKEEEELSSREFWMFIGMLVLLISAAQITFETSKPVYNKLFGTNLAPPANVVDHYNKWQLPLAIVVLILMAISQYFKYKSSDIKVVFKKLQWPIIITSAVVAFCIWYMNMTNPFHAFMLWAGLFSVISNFDYWLLVIKGKWNFAGASIAHIGFALIMLGALLANGNKQIISRNNSTVDLGKEISNDENVMLVKGDTVAMNNYYITYQGFKRDGVHLRFQVDYLKYNDKGKYEKEFSLFPVLQLNERMGNAAEPDTKHFLDKDIYTHLNYVDPALIKNSDTKDEYTIPETKNMKVGDTLALTNCLLVFEQINRKPDLSHLQLKDGAVDLAIAAQISIMDINKRKFNVNPILLLSGNYLVPIPDSLPDMGMRIALTKIDPDKEEFEIAYSMKKSKIKDFIVMKAIIFPYINVLWTGCLLLIIGSVLAIRHRIKLNKKA